MWRGYDSGVVLREDIIERVKYLRDSIEKLEKEVAAREERIQRLKKELGFIDYCTTDSSPQPSRS